MARTTMIADFRMLMLVIGLLSLFIGCHAGDYCDGKYCEHGCCDSDYGYDDECCSEIAAIVGLVVGLCVAVGFVVFIIILICVCRRRRTRGMVYQRNPGQTQTIIVSNSQGMTTQHGVVNTAGIPPGVVVYPPYTMYGPQTYGPQTGVPQQHPYMTQPYAPQAGAPPMYSQAPPSYEAAANPGHDASGVDNQAFGHKE